MYSWTQSNTYPTTSWKKKETLTTEFLYQVQTHPAVIANTKNVSRYFPNSVIWEHTAVRYSPSSLYYTLANTTLDCISVATFLTLLLKMTALPWGTSSTNSPTPLLLDTSCLWWAKELLVGATAGPRNDDKLLKETEEGRQNTSPTACNWCCL